MLTPKMYTIRILESVMEKTETVKCSESCATKTFSKIYGMPDIIKKTVFL